jgi:hypothetical protein
MVYRWAQPASVVAVHQAFPGDDRVVPGQPERCPRAETDESSGRTVSSDDVHLGEDPATTLSGFGRLSDRVERGQQRRCRPAATQPDLRHRRRGLGTAHTGDIVAGPMACLAPAQENELRDAARTSHRVGAVVDIDEAVEVDIHGPGMLVLGR